VTPYILSVIRGALPDLNSNMKRDAEDMIKLLENWDGSFAEKSI
jgi:hypothetical protein